MTTPAASKSARSRTVQAITERNMVESPLLRLPGEVRTMIYRHVFYEETFEIAENAIVQLDESQRRTIGCLTTSYQIWAEAKAFPFILNAFEFYGSESMGGFAQKLVKAQRLSIERIISSLTVCKLEVENLCEEEFRGFSNMREYPNATRLEYVAYYCNCTREEGWSNLEIPEGFETAILEAVGRNIQLTVRFLDEHA